MSNPNQELVNQLTEIRDYYKLSGDYWRDRAYTNAIYYIAHLPEKITNISELKQHKIPGVGKKTMEKIAQFIETGEIEKGRELKRKLPKLQEEKRCVSTLTGVYGIGKVKARQLCNDGYTTIEKLRKGVKRDPSILNSVQKKGLKYYEQLQKRLPHSFIKTIEVCMRYALNLKFKGEYKLKIAGSYRRNTPTSGDIDCLITPNSSNITLRNIVKPLFEVGLLVENLGIKKERFTGIGVCGEDYFHLDIEFIPENEWGSALLYFTGSQNFNINMRHTAKTKGYTLNQHGLYKIGRKEKILENPTEKDIFEALNMEYVEPEKR